MTPGQGQTVQIAGRRRGRHHQGRPRRRARRRDDEDPAQVHADLQERHRAAAPQDRPQRHGHRAGPRLAVGGHGAGGLDRPRSTRRCPTSTSTRSSPRWTPTRAATCSCSSAPRARGSTARARRCRPTLKRFEPTGRYLAKLNGALAVRERNIRRSIHNFRLLSQALGDKDDDLAALVDSSNRVFTAFADQDANLRAALQELPGALRRDEHHAGQGRQAGQRARADPRRPAARRPRPRAGAGPDAPVPRPDDADHPEPAAALRARRAARGQGPAARGERPRGGHAEADHLGQGAQLPAQRAGLQPAGQGGGLPVLGGVGQPRRRHRLLHPGRARPDPPRPGPGLVLDAAGAPPAQRARPAARHARRAAQPARPERRVPDDQPGRVDAGAAGPTTPTVPTLPVRSQGRSR